MRILTGEIGSIGITICIAAEVSRYTLKVFFSFVLFGLLVMGLSLLLQVEEVGEKNNKNSWVHLSEGTNSAISERSLLFPCC